MFTAETDLPENLDRAGLSAWAIANNTPARGPEDAPLAPFRPDLLSPAGQQPGYNLAMGSFQTNAPAPPANLLGAPGEEDWSIPKNTPAQAVAPAPRPRIPKSHIEHLIKNPDTADQFDSKYGSGTADEILNR